MKQINTNYKIYKNAVYISYEMVYNVLVKLGWIQPLVCKTTT